MHANIKFLHAHVRVRQYASTQYIDYVIRLRFAHSYIAKINVLNALAKITKFNRRN